MWCDNLTLVVVNFFTENAEIFIFSKLVWKYLVARFWICLANLLFCANIFPKILCTSYCNSKRCELNLNLIIIFNNPLPFSYFSRKKIQNKLKLFHRNFVDSLKYETMHFSIWPFVCTPHRKCNALQCKRSINLDPNDPRRAVDPQFSTPAGLISIADVSTCRF